MSTHYKGSEREQRALNAYITLTRATESLWERLHKHLVEEGLTAGQFAVLEALLHLGPLRQHELAKKVLRSKGNMTFVIDNLEKQGLVKREREEADRRCTSVSLTAAGKKLISVVFPRHVEALVKEMGALSQTEQESLRTLCRKLGKTGEEKR